ncbi:hypothetical protein QC334_25025 [Streptomyces sp. DH18]|uniref:MmyB family transcriptional regulator n=1 Tax=Streptomyces sp. DH18 TaxID=3040126 RepID=UPI002441E031|nr:hypothetical protein [Streptomyces sp. DH18]MDG9685956.1 hypothetical protein [Streptomyces sp. DH18]
MDVLAANELALALVPGLAGAPAGGSNLARHIFLDDAARSLYPQWDQVARQTIGYLRFSAARHAHHPRLGELVAELRARSTEFRILWAAQDVWEKTYGTRSFIHPLAGRFDLAYETLTLPGDEGQSLVVFTAVHGAAESALERLGGSPIACPQRKELYGQGHTGSEFDLELGTCQCASARLTSECRLGGRDGARRSVLGHVVDHASAGKVEFVVTLLLAVQSDQLGSSTRVQASCDFVQLLVAVAALRSHRIVVQGDAHVRRDVHGQGPVPSEGVLVAVAVGAPFGGGVWWHRGRARHNSGGSAGRFWLWVLRALHDSVSSLAQMNY